MTTELENIPEGSALSLAGLVSYSPGEIVSKTLTKHDIGRLILLAFSKGEGVSTHSSIGDELIQVLDGVARITLNGADSILREGEAIVLPAGLPHSVYAVEDFKMLLTVAFPPED